VELLGVCEAGRLAANQTSGIDAVTDVAVLAQFATLSSTVRSRPPRPSAGNTAAEPFSDLDERGRTRMYSATAQRWPRQDTVERGNAGRACRL
jgi:hypothetical protein